MEQIMINSNDTESNMQSAYRYLQRKLQYFYKMLEDQCKKVPNDARQLRYCKYITKFASHFGKEWCMVAGSTTEGTRLRSNMNEGDFDYLIISGVSIPTDALEHREDLPCFVHIRGDKIQHSFSHNLVDGKYLHSRILKEVDREAFKIMRGLFQVFTMPFDSKGKHSHDVDFNREAKPGMCKEHYVGFQLVGEDADNINMRKQDTDMRATNNYFQSVMDSSDLSPSMKSLLTNLLSILAETEPNDESSTAMGQTFGGLIEGAIFDSAIDNPTSFQPKRNKQSTEENDRNYIEDSSSKKVCRVKFNYKSSKDFIAAFPLEGKLKCLEEWRLRILTSDKVLWPSSEIVEKICQSEVYVVAKPAIVKPSADIDFCLGFNQAELILASDLSSDQRLCVLLLKALQKGYLKYYSSLLTTFHWKTAFYHQCGQIDPALFDRHSTILLALESVLAYMIECLDRRYLKHYFLESNLIAHLTETEANEIREKIKETIADPEAALQVYFDMNKENESSKQEEEISMKEMEEMKKRRNDPSNKKPADKIISMMTDLQREASSNDSKLTHAIMDTLYLVIEEETDIPFVRPNTTQKQCSLNDLLAHATSYSTTNFSSRNEKKRALEDLKAKAFATVLSSHRSK
ncbi:uncharacterized protein LOC127710881 isoform X1 [Mytilus californianus]|uniref:uncharacterized protein LOC127710881 isoform X1 n=2 Tax=Mytilus californianus TaxID=6549 RepID=UPI002245B10C|nr:uncharacterized protein LOC127710881 isoform X1 [Mytilus californianus]XP_052072800.1 uncharacterized protein LOC127710881 isoform X1 [Mytilus californianus]